MSARLVHARPWDPSRRMVRICAVAVTFAILTASSVRAGGAGADTAIYLGQAQDVLADSRGNLDSLQFYLPLGSVKDANDPTWNLAEGAAEAFQEDSGALRLLAPPDGLATLNAELIDALARASTAAEAAIGSLGDGDISGGETALAAFHVALSDLDRLTNSMPAAP